ncbi:MAG: cyclic nucleotide-binding domain-containing protein [Magnetococcales bacterium]|nr:cyclic nucleotide-binding domain-containing protein [Magnetococcales bacterium]NGZ26268.1 cyclic nucleotide-binding domain-containing protein [Magnetococcales bacterium]
MRESAYLEGQPHLVDKLRNLAVFRSFKEEQIKELLRTSKLQIHEKGEIIFQEDSLDNQIFCLISGAVLVSKDGEVIAKLRYPGDIFGEIGFLDALPRSARVEALENTTCLTVDADYLAKMEDPCRDGFHAKVYKLLAELLAQRLRETTDLYIQLKLEQERLARTSS